MSLRQNEWDDKHVSVRLIISKTPFFFNHRLTIHGTDTEDNNNGKYRTPLNYVSLKMVPEPTTATLSLLALAGLAARRRRR